MEKITMHDFLVFLMNEGHAQVGKTVERLATANSHINQLNRDLQELAKDRAYELTTFVPNVKLP